MKSPRTLSQVPMLSLELEPDDTRKVRGMSNAHRCSYSIPLQERGRQIAAAESSRSQSQHRQVFMDGLLPALPSLGIMLSVLNLSCAENLCAGSK